MPCSRPEPGWEDAVRGELDMFFSDPPETKDGYLVLKGNIHVTLAMTRLRLMSVLKTACQECNS